METIWKFPLPVTDLVELYLPKGATVLTIETQHGIPSM
jgi:hypothetical protein